MRSYVQWLEMISRTRPSEFAVKALQSQLERERANLEPSDFEKLLLALTQLEITPEIISKNGVVNVDYRSDGMGGKGRLYLEVGGRSLREVLDNEALDAVQVYVFMNNSQFAGLQIDAANTLLERLPAALRGLEALSLELLDCPEAGLENSDISSVLEWAVQRYLKAE
jgi:hypothetical protein